MKQKNYSRKKPLLQQTTEVLIRGPSPPFLVNARLVANRNYERTNTEPQQAQYKPSRSSCQSTFPQS
jgi:hypothetical protein